MLPEPTSCDFVAVDTETANETRGSLCALGITQVRDGRIIAGGSSLVNPLQRFNPYNTAVNGLDESMVASAPTLKELWPDIARLLDGQAVVAHNASFDVSVIRNSAAQQGLLDGPAFSLYCSWRLARRLWPDEPSHGLGYLAPSRGVSFDHHQAGQDATACALLVLVMAAENGAAGLDDLAALVGMMPGRVDGTSYNPVQIESESLPLRSQSGDPDADPTHPLFGRAVCITGTMASMPRRDAVELLSKAGAGFKTGVSAVVDYLVIGDADFVRFADGWETSKLRKAVALRGKGEDVEIIPEREFLKLLHG